MSCSAYVDESEPRVEPGSAGIYLLVATVVDDRYHDEVRSAMTALRLRGQRKVHWHDENDRRRAVLAEVAGRLPVRHLIVERVSRSERSERRRRLCLTRLLPELDQAGVAEICVESRERTQNQHDVALTRVSSRISSARRAGTKSR